MKVSSQAAAAIGHKDSKPEVPPLSLVPDDNELEESDQAKKGSFKLYSDPTDTTSAKYSFSMPYSDGSQSIRFQIKWVWNTLKVLRGMDITDGNAQAELIRQLCSGQVLTQFNEQCINMQNDARRTRATAAMATIARDPAETDAEWGGRRRQAFTDDMARPLDPPTVDILAVSLRSTIKMVCPYKALEKQKRFMRRKMRKPNDMRIRQFVNHLHRINFEELPQLPPFAAGQQLSQDELLDIILFGIPKSWVKEMDRQDFDPFNATTISQVVDFCERLESAEEFNPDQQRRKAGSTSNSKNNNKKTRFSNNKGKPSKGDGKWCEYHETDTHDTSECSVLKKMKDGGKNNSDKKPFNKNKTWTKKSDDAKKFSKKELNAIVKKASDKAVKKVTKELHAVAKRKRSDSDDDSTSSLHMLETEMKDVDEQLKNFNFEEVDKVEKAKS
jgi:hypothetical protein